MRLLLINPNTSESVTDLVSEHVRPLAGRSVEIVPVTGRFGARYIASRAAFAIAAHAALECLAEHVDGCDAVYLACFGDPAFAALQEVSPVPVIGMLDASCRAGAAVGRFGIVTGGVLWGPMLAELVGTIGFSDKLAAIRTIEATGGGVARDPDAALPQIVDACRTLADEDGAQVVILGGAALAGLAGRVAPHVPVPVICSVEAGARAALAAAATRQRRAGPGVTGESVGLSPELSRLLAAGATSLA